MSTENQSDLYNENNNAEQKTDDKQVSVDESLTGEIDKKGKSDTTTLEMKLTGNQSVEMDTVNHIDNSEVTKDQTKQCDANNHEGNDEVPSHDTSADDLDSPESVTLENSVETENIGYVNNTEMGGEDINNSNNVDIQPFICDVPVAYVPPQCNHVSSVPLVAQADGQLYPSAASPSSGMGHNQPMGPQGAIPAPQMGPYAPNGGSGGPCMQHAHVHLAGMATHQFNPPTPPQSGTSTPNTVPPMNNGNKGAGPQQPQHGVHVVHVHVNAGETFTVKVDDQLQHVEGKSLC